MTKRIVQHPEVPDRFGKLKTWNKFDASFFGMKSRLVNAMDPLGRVLMEKSYEAIVDAGKCCIHFGILKCFLYND